MSVETSDSAAEKKPARAASQKNPTWYKGGIIYELHVRAFMDSDGDGTGDLRGLTSKLDYLRDLGVTALWLLPFYPSPLKDDGYDIADYCNIHPSYGTLNDFKILLREAHRRGLRIITELVLNHTSDKHAWFQRARRAKTGSKYRDYYVWNDSIDKYKGTRIIFKDTEISNWTWDATAQAFYWHRFFSHQPDLNFDNPAVHEEMTQILDFWLDLGVDGVRLDAVPYLYEREGTSCENLPETHAFLKKMRKHVDEKYGDRMLLAEANQWPDDAVKYFGEGKGDECHMAFHFPLMPRMFMALRMEDRVPIVDILQQTPAIPENAQWALFLRNHDELTLEMVTDEERDYMYRMYAHVHQARLNLGIRRRLAPLVGNDRRRIELLTALLFSLPGTPVIYYGDEIGMGENIYLGDRNGVRTPMQWSADKNAGFSRANPQSLFLPINLDPENHYEAVNVEVQERNNYSLLWWTKRLIALYKRQKAFGAGSIEFLHPENRKIFACIRRYEDEIILVVANLSRFVQPVELELAAFQALVPVELFGRAEFPVITAKPYPLTLGPHAFYWFALQAKPSAQVESAGAPVGATARPLLNVEEDWEEIFSDQNHLQLERALQAWLPTRRWFGGKGRKIKNVKVQEIVRVPLPASKPGAANILGTEENLTASVKDEAATKAFLTFLQVEYVQNEPEIYVLPLACAMGKAADVICLDWSPLVVLKINVNASGSDGVIYDAIADKKFAGVLLGLIAKQQNLEGLAGKIDGWHTSEFKKDPANTVLESSVSKAEQINSSIIFGEQWILKIFRRLDYGVNPDLEIGRVLTAQKSSFVPSVAGALEYRTGKDEPATVAMLSSYVPKAKNAWDFTLDALGKFYERIQTLPPEKRLAQMPLTSLTKLATSAPSEQAREMIDTYLESARILGERTAAMHLALAAETENAAFSPEYFTPHGQRGLFQSLRNLTRQNLLLLARQASSLPAELSTQVQQVLALEQEILKRMRGIYERRLDATVIRIHGDFHLGQVLYTGKDFLIIDFEGEPALAISERQLKRSPLIDVASMVRSFHYASQAALLKFFERGEPAEGQLASLSNWSKFWARWVSAVFYSSYLQAAKGASFLPSNEADLQAMMEIFLLRKAVYELGYELNNRPDWVKIPLQGILELVPEKSEAKAI
ncbi:MAG TPA: maltose alpha-D-glucosyltransferase [Verrucomicrobiae bacterium]|nr:maltose alpha-D-glucosyltransferase [Verrucomicrobiae bacterium]